LSSTARISGALQKIIDERTEPWGIHVISVEVKDVLIPAALENAMSMQAQADRERSPSARLRTYANNPVALHLRAMNTLYEGLKENSTIVIVPSSAVDTMQLGSMAGLTALTMGIGQEKTIARASQEPQELEQASLPVAAKIGATPLVANSPPAS
jgi:regulator of protease activity HflC (stomatin/prohibitin superfamily)